MEKTMAKPLKKPELVFGSKDQRDFFIDHLNRIYCAKCHLAKRLPEIAEQACFKELRYAVMETWEDVGKQIVRMDAIYLLIDAKSSFKKCDDLIYLVENAFTAIHQLKKPGDTRPFDHVLPVEY